MKAFAVALALLFPLGVLAAPPTLEVPAEVKAEGEYARFSPKTDAVSVIYIGLDGAQSFPTAELADKKRFLLPVYGRKAGKYRFVAVAAGKDGEQVQAEFVVIVPDPFTLALAQAYKAEVAPDRAEHLKVLVGFYRQAIPFADRTDVTTWGQLDDGMRRVAGALGMTGKLLGVHKTIGTELSRVLPVNPITTPNAPLDAAGRAQAKAAFGKVVTALEEVLR